MDFDNLPHHVLIEIMMYVSIQDRFENVRIVSKRWKSVAEDSFRRQRKLTVNLGYKSLWKMKIKPSDHHSVIKLTSPCENHLIAHWQTGMVRYMSHVFSLGPNLEELYMYEIFEGDGLDQKVTELLNLMHSHGIKLKSFTCNTAYLTEWPFPLEILESLAVEEVSDELAVKILHEATNLKHLELRWISHNWPTFPSGLLSLKFRERYDNKELSKLINSPAFHTIESLEGICIGEEFDPQTTVFPKLRRVSFEIHLGEERCLESCNKLITFLVEQITLLESLGLHFLNNWGNDIGATDILFSIPQFNDVLHQLKKLDISFDSQYITVNMLNVLRSCQNTELSMGIIDCLDEDGNLLNDLLSFLVDMSGNIKYFRSYTDEYPVKVCDLDVLRQLHTSHEIVLRVCGEKESNPDHYLDIPQVDIQNCVTEEERQKYVVYVEITAR